MSFSLARTMYFVPTLSKASPVAGEYPYSVKTTMSVGTVNIVSADMLYILPRGVIVPFSMPFFMASGKSSSVRPMIFGDSSYTPLSLDTATMLEDSPIPHNIAVAVADAEVILSILSIVTVLPIPSTTVTLLSFSSSPLPLFVRRTAAAAAAMITTAAMMATMILLFESIRSLPSAKYDLALTANKHRFDLQYLKHIP